MGRIRKFGYKPKFRGNKYIKIKHGTASCEEREENKIESEISASVSASSKKLLGAASFPGATQMRDSEIHGMNSVSASTDTNILISMSLLRGLIENHTCCKNCGGNVTLYEDVGKTKGIVSNLVLKCLVCKCTANTMSSHITRSRLYENNVRLVYALRSIGEGRTSGAVLCAVMNIPPPPRKFDIYNKTIGAVVAEVSESTMLKAAKEAVHLNYTKFDPRHIAAGFDGSWQKRGHTSLNGIVSATAFDTGKVLDIEIITKFCDICSKNPTTQHVCKKDYDGSSGGMEVAGVANIFKRSIQSRGVLYTDYLGDGDSKAYQKVVEDKPYGPTVKINKLECIGHVQKRMGSRLLKICKEKKLGGKGGLTKVEIDRIQNYYGMAIRNNCNNVEAMRRAIWAIFFHKLSTDEKPQHHLCPRGPDSWCKFNNPATTSSYKHKNSVPENILLAVKPIFRDLSQQDLLKKCLHGKTQNPNESLNSVIWTRLPKTVFVRKETLTLGVHDAVMCFNAGVSKKTDVLRLLGTHDGINTAKGLKSIDMERIRYAEISARNATKDARIARRSKKRRKVDKEEEAEPQYSAGMF